MAAGARQSAACNELGIDERTLQRWHKQSEDGRCGPKTTPRNALTTQQRQRVLDVLTSERFRNNSPRQVVLTLADEGVYVASESTMYRVLHGEQLLAHRGRARPPMHHRPPELVAAAVNTVWSWDITYLRAPVRGSFFYLYLVEDLYSRSIVGCRIGGMRAGAPGHIGHVSADSAIRCAASRATLKNSSPSPSLRSSYQAAASSSSASASASSASRTTGFQLVGDALLSFVPGDKCGRAVGDGLCATVELLDPSLLSTRFRIAVEAEQEVLGERGALVDR